jgi:pimeloyl-ACP methyl ester carboxylesterase
MLRRAVAWSFLLSTTAAGLLALASVEDQAVRRDQLTFAPPGTIVRVGSSSWHVNCSGTPRPEVPTVVLEAGLGESSLTWADLQDLLDEHLRICSYDRLGYGWSGDAEGPRDATTEARELHAVLGAVGEERSLVLVAHSLGGLIAQTYAAHHPESVRALVLLDPTTPASVTGPQILPIAVSTGQEALVRLGLLRPFAADIASGEPEARTPREAVERASFLYRSETLSTSIMELSAAPDSAADVADVRVAQPLVVLLPRGATESQLAEFAKVGADVSVRIVEADSHYLHYAAPGAVAKMIDEVVTAAAG